MNFEFLVNKTFMIMEEEMGSANPLKLKYVVL